MAAYIEFGRVNAQDALYIMSAGVEALDSDEDDIEWMLNDMNEKGVIGTATAAILKAFIEEFIEERKQNAKKDS